MLKVEVENISLNELGYILHKNPDGKHKPIDIYKGTGTFSYLKNNHIPTFSVSYKQKSDAGSNEYVTDEPYVDSYGLSRSILKFFSTTINENKTFFSMRATFGPVRIEHAYACISSFTNMDITINPIPLPYKYKPIHCMVSLKSSNYTMSQFLRIIALSLGVIDTRNDVYIDDNDVDRFIRMVNGLNIEDVKMAYLIRRYLRLPSFIHMAKERLGLNTDTLNLQDTRIKSIIEILKLNGCHDVMDLGCGEGDLILEMLKDVWFKKITAIDPSPTCLKKLTKNIEKYTFTPIELVSRIKAFQGTNLFHDSRWNSDTVTMIEVIEHMDLHNVDKMIQNVFSHGFRKIIITTPNREWNCHFENSGFRHHDHRFEFDRNEFNKWCTNICDNYNYHASYFLINHNGITNDTDSPTQGVVFTRL